ncbi:MAG: ATP-binding protein [Alphaproteobacteria bacterium]|nr:ATP-binding protein [Alphaproteobacteria bacterium]
MRLGAKTILVLSGVIALSTALNFLVVREFVYPSFAELEKQKAEENIGRVVQSIDNEIKHLSLLTFDWAAWNDTYEFVVDQDPDYAESNLVWTSFSGSNLNLIHFYDIQGRLVWGESYDLETEEPLELAEFPDHLALGHPFIAHASPESDIVGIVLTSAGPMLLASRPIITSDQEGPIRGTLMMGRLLTSEVLSTLAEQVAVEFEVRPISSGSVSSEASDVLSQISSGIKHVFREGDGKTLDVYEAIPDINGVPALLVSASTPRDITGIGQRTIQVTLISLIAAGLVVMAFTAILARIFVVGPVVNLTDIVLSIGKTGDLSRRVALTKRNDEIGLLSREFDGMLGKLTEARDQLQQQSFQAGIAEMAAGVLHNVRNQLNPLVIRLGRLQQLETAPSGDKVTQVLAELSTDHTEPERRQKLIEYLRLSQDKALANQDQLRDDLAVMSRQVAKVEEVLAEQDRFSWVERQIEPSGLADVVAQAMRMMPDNLGKDYRIEIDPNVESAPLVLAEKFILSQIIQNLLMNAAEAINNGESENGEILVSATHDVASDGAECVHLTIQDNGCGITEERLEKVFERGFTTKGAKGGAGLHWCANSIANLNGRIYAESAGTGQGATLHLELPVAATITRAAA